MAPTREPPRATAIPTSWSGASDWSSTSQPITVAVSGLSRARKAIEPAASRSMPRNHSQYASAVLTRAR
jgi:hypothetical protein